MSLEVIGTKAFVACSSLVEVTVRSESEYGFLDGSGGEYTTFVYSPSRFL